MEKVYKVHPEAEEFYFPGNEIGILVSHGFTGSTQSMRYLGTQIAKAGFTVTPSKKVDAPIIDELPMAVE